MFPSLVTYAGRPEGLLFAFRFLGRCIRSRLPHGRRWRGRCLLRLSTRFFSSSSLSVCFSLFSPASRCRPSLRSSCTERERQVAFCFLFLRPLLAVHGVPNGTRALCLQDTHVQAREREDTLPLFFDRCVPHFLRRPSPFVCFPSLLRRSRFFRLSFPCFFLLSSELQHVEDLGRIAEQSSCTTRTLFPPPRLTIEGVYDLFLGISQCSGRESVFQKRNLLKRLLVGAKGPEPKYIIRFLQQRMRTGASHATVYQVIAASLALSLCSLCLPCLRSLPSWGSSLSLLLCLLHLALCFCRCLSELAHFLLSFLLSRRALSSPSSVPLRVSFRFSVSLYV